MRPHQPARPQLLTAPCWAGKSLQAENEAESLAVKPLLSGGLSPSLTVGKFKQEGIGIDVLQASYPERRGWCLWVLLVDCGEAFESGKNRVLVPGLWTHSGRLQPLCL